MQSFKYKVLKGFWFKDTTGKSRPAKVGEEIAFHETTESDVIVGLVRFKKILPVDYPPTIDVVVIREILMPIKDKMEKAVAGETVTLKAEVAAPLVATLMVRPVGPYWQPGRLARPKLPPRETIEADTQALKNWVKGY
jgi:hypothetical protein